jgi:hypothetical protein
MSAPRTDDFSPELAAWLAQADGKITVDPRRWPGAYASLDGGERAILVDRGDDGWFTVSVSLRGGDPEPRFRTPSFDVVERFIANEAGPAGRAKAGLPGNVHVPFALAEIFPGSTLRTLSDGPLGGLEELSVGGVVLGEFGFGPHGRLAHASAVRASHYGTATVQSIAQSYLSADGAPLFTVRER